MRTRRAEAWIHDEAGQDDRLPSGADVPMVQAGVQGRVPTMRPVGVLDPEGVLALFAKVAGRRFVGPVDGCGYVELVFSDHDREGGSLVSVCVEGRNAGTVLLGFVADPEHYVAGCGWERNAA